MYTVIDGKVLFATRDGEAFRGESVVVPAEPDSGRRSNKSASKADSRKSSASSADKASTSATRERRRIRTAKPASPTIRKLCEVLGCTVQPSYGPPGTTRPRFCTGHKKPSMVGLKNRPCLYPGCETRPHYGLSGGRAVFCVQHKKPDMVHILKEAIGNKTKSKGVRARSQVVSKRRRRQSVEKVPNQNAERRATVRSEESPARHDPSLQGIEAVNTVEPPSYQEGHIQPKRGVNGEQVSQGSHQSTKTGANTKLQRGVSPRSPKDSKSAPQVRWRDEPRVESPDHVRVQHTGKSTRTERSSQQYNEASSIDYRASTSTQSAESEGDQISGSVSFLSPQVDEKSGHSSPPPARRRTRALSRKALEAAGILEGEGEQWMTKERKAEEIRKARNLREQRKAAAALGLPAGHVIEISSAPDGISSNRDKVAAGSLWRKLTPAEMQQAEQAGVGREPDRERPAGGEQTLATVAPDTAVDSGSAWPEGKPKKRGKKASDNPPNAHKRAKEVASTRVYATDWPVRDTDRGSVKGGCTEMKSRLDIALEWAGVRSPFEVDYVNPGVCQFDACSREATYGVNGIVRYCKIHRLFGMHEIGVSPP